MTLFIISFLVVCFGLIYKSNYKYLCNELFWFVALWVFIFGVYFASRVNFGSYGLSLELIIFLVIIFTSFFLGRKKAFQRKTYKVFQTDEEQKTWIFPLIGVTGVLMLLFDIWRLNGISAIIEREAGVKGDYSLSIIGIVGSLMVPILLVEGLYLIASKIKHRNSISIPGLLLLFIYIIPCVLDSGRETILYSIIGILSIVGYKSYLKTPLVKPKKNKRRRLLVGTLSIAFIAGLLYIMYQISTDRFGETEIRVFLQENDVPSAVMKDAEGWGEFSFLYYNIVSYFGHQVPFLDFIFKDYQGPYMFGMYEFNIISRRLPDSLGLDYMQVYDQIHKLYSTHRTNFGNGWFTVLGSFIIDYGRVGAIFVTFLCGYLIGMVRKKFLITLDSRYTALLGVICLSMISTVQLGPFYSTHIYGAYIWWYFIFKNGKKQIVRKKYEGA